MNSEELNIPLINHYKQLGMQIIVLTSTPGLLYLHKIIVPINKRRKGLGSAFLMELITYSQQQNLFLNTYPAVKPATAQNKLIRFFKKHGFVKNNNIFTTGIANDYIYVPSKTKLN